MEEGCNKNFWSNRDREIVSYLIRDYCLNQKSLRLWLTFVFETDKELFCPSIVKYYKQKTIRPLAKEYDLSVKTQAHKWFQIYWTTIKTDKWKETISSLRFDSTQEPTTERLKRLLYIFRWRNNSSLFEQDLNTKFLSFHLSDLVNQRPERSQEEKLSNYLGLYSTFLVNLWDKKVKPIKESSFIETLYLEDANDSKLPIVYVLRNWKITRDKQLNSFDKKDFQNDPIRYFNFPFSLVNQKNKNTFLCLQSFGKDKYFWIIKVLKHKLVHHEDEKTQLEIEQEYNLYSKKKNQEHLVSFFEKFYQCFSLDQVLTNLIDFSRISPYCVEKSVKQERLSKDSILNFIYQNEIFKQLKKTTTLSTWIYGSLYDPSWIPLFRYFPNEDNNHFISNSSDWLNIEFQIGWFILELQRIGVQVDSIHPYQIFLQPWTNPIPKAFIDQDVKFVFQESFHVKIHPGSNLYSNYAHERITNAWKTDKTINDWKTLFLKYADDGTDEVVKDSILYQRKRATLIWISSIQTMKDMYPNLPLPLKSQSSTSFFEIANKDKTTIKNTLQDLFGCKDLHLFLSLEPYGIAYQDIEWVPSLNSALKCCFDNYIETKADNKEFYKQHYLFPLEKQTLV